MPARARRSDDQRVMSAPSKLTRPPRAGSRPITVLSSVVLPTPLRPIRQRTWPWATDRWTPQSTCEPPKATSSRSTVSIGRLAAAPEVDLEPARIRLHLLHRALHQHRALVKPVDLAA